MNLSVPQWTYSFERLWSRCKLSLQMQFVRQQNVSVEFYKPLKNAATGGTMDTPARKRVLLIEDSPTYAEFLVMELADIADVTVVTTAADGIKAQAEGGWDLIVADMVLPGAVDNSLVRMLKVRAACPVMAVTHYRKVAESTDGIEIQLKNFEAVEMMREKLSKFDPV